MLRYALYDIRASILSTDRFFFGVALPIVFFKVILIFIHDWHGAVRCRAEHRGD